ncbi:MAG: hypothetical protein IJ899_01260 [Blautia sp.]|nr:hypothetical protein [Blautia sp.]
MKKRMISLIWLCAAMLTLSSCGLKSASPVTPVEPTYTPTPDPALLITPEPTQGELLEMQASPESEYKNVVGTNTPTALSVIVENRIGTPVEDFYLRYTPDDDDDEDWGNELITNSFRLDNGDKMLCYYEKSTGSGSANRYDLRVNLANEDNEELYFRYIPLESISRITLRMDGTGYDALPYATYVNTNGSNAEISTLEEVKRRVGLSDDDESDESEMDEEEEDGQEEYLEEEEYEEPEEEPEYIDETEEEEELVDPGIIEGNSNASNADMDTARSYIGQSVDALEGALGASNSVDYVDEPELGETGYHYYNSYTVMTSVDENGNEIVVSIW